MLNIKIELREGSVKGDEKFNVRMITGKDSALEANVDYCPCCFYKLNINKNKVKKLILGCFEAEHASTGKISRNYINYIYGNINNFNIILEAKIVHNKIPLLKGIVIKDKHVIKEIKSSRSGVKALFLSNEAIQNTETKEESMESPDPKRHNFINVMDSHKLEAKEIINKYFEGLAVSLNNRVKADDGAEIYSSIIKIHEHSIIKNNTYKEPFLSILKDFHLTNGNANDDLIIIKSSSVDIRVIGELIFNLTKSKSVSVIYYSNYYYISCNNSFKELTNEEKINIDTILNKYQGAKLYILNK